MTVVLRAFDGSGRQIAAAHSMFGSNLLSSGDAGSSPNEFIDVAPADPISSIVFEGGPVGASLTLDDLTVNTVPEPASFLLFGAGLLGIGMARRSRGVVHNVPRLSGVWFTFLARGEMMRPAYLLILRRAALCAVCVALLPAQTVGPARVSPASVATANPSTVTVSARVTGPPGGVVQGVNLIRYDQNGLNAVVVATMYDDQTHGDVKAGDGIFTGQVTVAEPGATVLFFRVSAAFRGLPKRVLSPPVPLVIATTATAGGTLTALATEINAGDIDNASKRFSPSPLNKDILGGCRGPTGSDSPVH